MKYSTRIRTRTAGIAALALALLLLLAGCAEGADGGKLAFKDVTLTADPATPAANQAAKLTVAVNNDKYAKQTAVVQLQINSAHSLPQLIDTVKDGETYTANYTFPAADDYTVTIHMQYPSEHYAFARSVKVAE